MYIPPYFKEEDYSRILVFMKAHPFALLISGGKGIPSVTHLPFVFYEKADGLVIKSHMSRANPQWQEFDGETMAKVVFSGPHAYISPSLYSDPINVPTWNYVAVHATGKPKVMHDPADSMQFLDELINTFDPQYQDQWRTLPKEYIDGLHKGIVTFEIEVEELEGKFKLNQNKPVQDRVHIIETLGSNEDSSVVEMTKYMQQYLDKKA